MKDLLEKIRSSGQGHFIGFRRVGFLALFSYFLYFLSGVISSFDVLRFFCSFVDAPFCFCG